MENRMIEMKHIWNVLWIVNSNFMRGVDKVRKRQSDEEREFVQKLNTYIHILTIEKASSISY